MTEQRCGNCEKAVESSRPGAVHCKLATLIYFTIDKDCGWDCEHWKERTNEQANPRA